MRRARSLKNKPGCGKPLKKKEIQPLKSHLEPRLQRLSVDDRGVSGEPSDGRFKRTIAPEHPVRFRDRPDRLQNMRTCEPGWFGAQHWIARRTYVNDRDPRVFRFGAWNERSDAVLQGYRAIVRAVAAQANTAAL